MSFEHLPQILKDEIISLLQCAPLNWNYAIETNIHCALKTVLKPAAYGVINDTVLNQIIKHKKHKVFYGIYKPPKYEEDIYCKLAWYAVLSHNNKPDVVKLVIPFAHKPIPNKLLYYALLNNTFECYLLLLPYYRFNEDDWSVKELNKMLAHTYRSKELRMKYLKPLVPYLLHRPEDLMAMGWCFT